MTDVHGLNCRCTQFALPAPTTTHSFISPHLRVRTIKVDKPSIKIAQIIPKKMENLSI